MSRLKIPANGDDHIQGASIAPCTLVEYGDYQCPYCGAAYPVVKRLQQNFGDNLRFIFRNFPLTQIHPFAELAAETAEFASSHGKFWEAHDLIYENQDKLGEELFFAIAAQLGLPEDDFTKALRKRTYLPRVRRDFSGGVRSGGQRHASLLHQRRIVSPRKQLRNAG